jgi:hypothetical protein
MHGRLFTLGSLTDFFVLSEHVMFMNMLNFVDCVQDPEELMHSPNVIGGTNCATCRCMLSLQRLFVHI